MPMHGAEQTVARPKGWLVSDEEQKAMSICLKAEPVLWQGGRENNYFNQDECLHAAIWSGDKTTRARSGEISTESGGLGGFNHRR